MRLEARALAEIRHPYVVQITDGGVTPEGVVWFTMELLHGRSLRGELNDVGALGIERALRFGIQIALGVQAAHDCGVIHRDLKPENVFVVEPGDTVRVLDFGTSKFRRAQMKTTDRFRMLGTHAYMSPERLQADVTDARADVYALGHILYEMVGGMHCLSEGPGPLDLPPPYELGIRQIYAVPVPLVERAPGTPADVSAIVQRALSKKREERQQSMTEMASELEAALVHHFGSWCGDLDGRHGALAQASRHALGSAASEASEAGCGGAGGHPCRAGAAWGFVAAGGATHPVHGARSAAPAAGREGRAPHPDRGHGTRCGPRQRPDGTGRELARRAGCCIAGGRCTVRREPR